MHARCLHSQSCYQHTLTIAADVMGHMTQRWYVRTGYENVLDEANEP